VASAYAAHLARRSAEYGLMLNGPVTVDMKRVKARKDAVVGASNRGVEHNLKSLKGCTVHQGHARFISPNAVAVGSEILEANHIFINGPAGEHPRDSGTGPGRVFTNIMDLDCVPPHLVIVGGSYIGLEFAQICRRFGNQVTVVEMTPRLVPREDEEVSAAVVDILQDEGTELRLAAECLSVAKGDCNGKGAFTHTAYNEFEIVAANLLDKEQRHVSDRILAYNLYTDPPLGRIGMTEAEVRKSNRHALMATMPMQNVGRAYERGETKGFMKILVDRDNQEILGASILGIGEDEVIHVLLDLMYAKAPYTVLQRAMHIHPTVSELLPTMMGTLKPL
jgi:pyruvate/2-oxoglutarate dehydrogenase complex dihydrolipoamide dehydrogenase (E3) component